MRTIYCSRPAETDSPVPALRSAMLSNTPVSSDEYNYYMRHEPTSGLYIILRQPKAFTRDTTRLLRTVASFLVLGSIALCVFVSFNLSRQLSDPIGKITSAMAEVEKGQPGYPRKPSPQRRIGAARGQLRQHGRAPQNLHG